MSDSGQLHDYEWSPSLVQQVGIGRDSHPSNHSAVEFYMSGVSQEDHHSDPGASAVNDNGSNEQQNIDTPVSGLSGAPSALGETSQHVWVQLSPVTTTKALAPLIITTWNNRGTYFGCGWSGCTHPVGFTQKAQLVTHIRSIHLQEKPFHCTTCGQYFSRKQEAIRHVNTFNGGKKYKCSACEQAFSRKSYRDNHEELCFLERFFPAAYPYQ